VGVRQLGYLLNMTKPQLSGVLQPARAVSARPVTCRGPPPTEAGSVFYERALRVLTEVNEAEAAAQGAGTGLEGRLRICAPVTFARLHMVPKLSAFLDAHPKLWLELVMEDRPIDLVADNIDAALRLGALPDSALVARKVTQGERLWWRAQPISRAEVSRVRQRICVSTTRSSMTKARAAWHGASGVARRKPRSTCRSGSPSALQKAYEPRCSPGRASRSPRGGCLPLSLPLALRPWPYQLSRVLGAAPYRRVLCEGTPMGRDGGSQGLLPYRRPACTALWAASGTVVRVPARGAGQAQRAAGRCAWRQPSRRGWRGGSQCPLPGAVGCVQCRRPLRQHKACEQAALLCQAARAPATVSTARQGELVRGFAHCALLQTVLH
jgi:hypothetical protein